MNTSDEMFDPMKYRRTGDAMWAETHLLVQPKPKTEEQLSDERYINALRVVFDRDHERKSRGNWRVDIGPISSKLGHALREYRDKYGYKCPEEPQP